MNKWLMIAVLVLFVLVSAIGLRNATASQQKLTVASTSQPMPPTPYLVASTSLPMPPTPYSH